MAFHNRTIFSAELFRQFNLKGALNGVVAVRGTFDFVHDGVLRISREQTAFQWSDVYESDDPRSSHLLIPADFVPYKPGTDVTALCVAYAPGGKPQSDWICGVRVGNRVEKLLRVHGPRFWEPKLRRFGSGSEPLFEGWRLSAAEPAVSVALSWSKAFGGARPLRDGEPPPPEFHPDNGLGPGLLDLHSSPRDRKLSAPQIESSSDPILDWRQDHAPQGLAPVPPWWFRRRRHVGAVDDKWMAERHPILPEDFDYHFYQTAHPDLVIEPWLNGDETLELAHMHPEIAVLRTRLPGISLTARVSLPDVDPIDFPLVLDGVHIDFRRGASRVHLTWRMAFRYEKEEGDVELVAREGAGA